MGTIYKKLAEFQAKCPTVTLDGFNPHFKSKFCTLSNLIKIVSPVLSSVGLAHYHTVKEEDGLVWLETRIIDADTERYIFSRTLIKQDPNPQKTGIQLTYYRRYHLEGLLGVSGSEDVDGEGSEPTPEVKKQEVKPPEIPVEKWMEGIDHFLGKGKTVEALDKWLDSKSADIAMLSKEDQHKITVCVRETKTVMAERLAEKTAPPETVICPNNKMDVIKAECLLSECHKDCEHFAQKIAKKEISLDD